MRSLRLLAIAFLLPAALRAAEPFEIKEGDRVLLLGDTLLERENTYGYLETRMHEQFPDRHFTVRNLSWAGETPRGWSRASFDSPEKGTERLKEDIAKVRPTVVFLGFGMAASLQEMTDRSGDITLNPDPARYGAEPMSAGRFKKELGELMDAIVAQAAAAPAAAPGSTPVPGVGAGVSPERTSAAAAESATPSAVAPAPKVREGGTPSPTPGTGVLPGASIRFVLLSPIRHEDLRAVKPGLPDPAPHNRLLEQYSRAIEQLAKERGGRFVDFFERGELHAAAEEQKRQSIPGLVRIDGRSDVAQVTDNGIHLYASGYMLLTDELEKQLAWTPRRPFGSHTFEGRESDPGDRVALNAAVIRKNELFFHQFRPANSTYLFGFRKHEQGQNAKEMPMFDPLIAAAEAEIDRLKRQSPGAASNPSDAASQLQPAASDSQVRSPDSQVRTSNSQVTSSNSQNRTPDSQPTPANLASTTSKVADSTPNLQVAASNLQVATPNPGSPGSNPLAAMGNPGPQPPPLPDFTLEDGYQIELWAQNPYLEKPTQMNWDPQGRLWVCSSSLYPQIEPGQAANDKILILSDTDGDGKADKSEIFADGLLIPTGVVPDLFGDVAMSRSGEVKTPDANPKSPNPQITKSPNRFACYVGQSTELLYFSDPQGTGHATEKRIVFSGFGTEDTHHIVHTLHWGPDGRLFFHQSVYIHTHLETPWGMVRLNSGGVFAYDPRTERVEVFIKGLWNTWGQAEDDWGQSFFTDGAGSTGLSWGFPGAIFAPFEGSRRQMASISPGSYPKFAGLEIVKSPHFPAEWQGNAITCDFRAHRIVRFAITDLSDPQKIDPQITQISADGEKAKGASSSSSENLRKSAQSADKPSPKSGYTTVEQPDLVRTTDLSFRPIDVKLGPDGALYVADWSNPVINHGEVDFRDPRRDHHMGRIWRITKKDTPALKWEPLLGKKNEELPATAWKNAEETRERNAALVEKLLSKSGWEREQARRVILSSDSIDLEVEAEYNRQTKRANDQARKSEPGIILDFAPAPTIKSALQRFLGKASGTGDPFRNLEMTRLPDCDGWVVGTNTKVLSMDVRRLGRRGADDWNLWHSFLSSDDPRLRLEAMRALARIPTYQSASLVLDAALKTPENDPHYDFAAWLSINDLAKPWTDAIASGAWKTEGHEAQLAYGLKSIDPTLASATLSRLFAAGQVPVDGSGPWIELIGDAGGPAELQRLLDGLLAGYVGDCCETDATRAIDNKLALTGPVAPRAVAALLTAARVRNVRPAAHSELVTALFHAQGEIGLGAIHLAGLWKAPDAVAKITELLDSRETKPPLRRAAVDGLRAAGGQSAMQLLNVLTRPEEETDTRAAALVAIAQLKVDAGVVKAAEILPTLPEAALLGTWRGLLGVKGAPDAFAVKFGAGGTRSVVSVAPASGMSVAPASGAPASQSPDGAGPSKGQSPDRAGPSKSIFASMPAAVIVAAQRAAQELGRPGAKLLAALAPAGSAAAGAPSTDYAGLAAQTVQNGDPAKGELVYRRATSACVTCHAIGGAGGHVGPDMTSIGASAPLDYLIESILNPNAKVKEGYNAVTLTMLDGAQVTGIQARETASELILRDAAGTEKAVPKQMVKAKTDIGSMMPAGLTATMKPREAIDLYAFLSQLGKPGPYDASKGKVARVWRMYPAAAAGEVVSANYDPAKNPGFPGYTLVDGRFVKDLLSETAPLIAAGADDVLLATQFQANGKTRLSLTGSTAAWLDGQPLPSTGEFTPELTNGTHTLVVKVSVKALPEVLRASSDDARFLGN